jgi:hypothetical protein
MTFAAQERNDGVVAAEVLAHHEHGAVEVE